MSKKLFKFALVGIFLVALVLRWWYLPAKAVSFAYDQARDAFVVQEILTGRLKVLGPPVSGVPGLFHGVLYYYVIAPAYLLGRGDPVTVAYWMSFISSIGVFTVFYLGYLLTKKLTPALISALIFAVSFEASQYANLLTNASMALWFVPVLYIGLYLWITHSASPGQANLSRWAPVIAGAGFGLAVQSEVALLYHLAPIVLWLLLFRNKITKKEVLLFASSFVVAVSSMIVSEIKFGFPGVKGIYYLLSSQDAIVQGREFSDFLIRYINQVGEGLSYTIFPLNIVFGSLIGFSVLIYALVDKFKQKKKAPLSWQMFLATYIGAHLVALPFGGSNMRHIMAGATPAIAVFVGIFLWKYFGKYRTLLAALLVMLIIINVTKILKDNKNGQTIFPLQPDLVLSKEIALVDYTYQEADGKSFSISSLTSPLYVNTLWSYLYNWHGVNKYGSLPHWLGRDQIGQLGNNLKVPTSETSSHFFIIEPTYGIPDLFVGYAFGDQDSVSKLISQKKIGELRVQKRLVKYTQP